MDEEEAPSPNCFAVTLRLTVFFAVGSERKGFCEEVPKRRVLEGVNAKVTGNKNQKAIARSFILKRTPNGAQLETEDFPRGNRNQASWEATHSSLGRKPQPGPAQAKVQ